MLHEEFAKLEALIAQGREVIEKASTGNRKANVQLRRIMRLTVLQCKVISHTSALHNPHDVGTVQERQEPRPGKEPEWPIVQE